MPLAAARLVAAQAGTLGAALTGAGLAAAAPAGWAGGPLVAPALAWVAWLPLMAALAARAWRPGPALLQGAGAGALCASLSGLAWVGSPIFQSAWPAVAQGAVVAGAVALAARRGAGVAAPLAGALALAERAGPTGWGLAVAASQADEPGWRAVAAVGGAAGLAALVGAVNGALTAAALAWRRRSGRATAAYLVAAAGLWGLPPRLASPPTVGTSGALRAGIVQVVPGPAAPRARVVQARELWRQGAQVVISAAGGGVAGEPEPPPRPRPATVAGGRLAPAVPTATLTGAAVRAAGHVWAVLGAAALDRPGPCRAAARAAEVLVVDISDLPAAAPSACDVRGRPAGVAWRRLAAARLRAAEVGRPVAVGGDDGMALSLDAGGARSAAAPPCRRANIIAQVFPDRRTTPFSRAGDVPLAALAAGVSSWVWWAKRRSHSATS